MTVSFDTVRSLRKLVRLKLGATDLEKAFLNSPRRELENRSPRDILGDRDFYEVMRLSVMVSAITPHTHSDSRAA
ncbi:hypothetical protein PVT71_22720 (plasmid) [Salipiger sp. H15]|uniref:Antitoxin Xre/MbcA/ParS-like toxin-binding domain-containing protein n=1 Tax=Alloyangia sp. H15 TaxID=3029062 RepID=A0AAU8AQB8_9RHOB